MRYKLSALSLVVVAGVLSLVLALRHLDADQATIAQPLQTLDSDAQGETGGSAAESVQSPQQARVPSVLTPQV